MKYDLMFIKGIIKHSYLKITKCISFITAVLSELRSFVDL